MVRVPYDVTSGHAKFLLSLSLSLLKTECPFALLLPCAGVESFVFLDWGFRHFGYESVSFKFERQSICPLLCHAVVRFLRRGVYRRGFLRLISFSGTPTRKKNTSAEQRALMEGCFNVVPYFYKRCRVLFFFSRSRSISDPMEDLTGRCTFSPSLICTI